MAFSLRKKLGACLAGFLSKSIRGYKRFDAVDATSYQDLLRPGDLLLVEGDTRFSVIVKYLTQSTWSHVALYVGPHLEDEGLPLAERMTLIEADVNKGVIAIPLSKYRNYNLRVCRPVGLNDEDVERVCAFMKNRIGTQYDLKNILDLLRYFLPKPPFFSKDRRRYIELGSGDPSRAICSSIIVEAYHSIGYPVLPRRGAECAIDVNGDGTAEVICPRHPSLFAPRDFDLSPYFEVVKPTLVAFDHHDLTWEVDSDTKELLPVVPEPPAIPEDPKAQAPGVD